MGQHGMRNLTTALLVSTLVLTGCSTIRDSRVNPFNWFGRSQVTPVAADMQSNGANPLIPEGRSGFFSFRRSNAAQPLGPLAAQVTDVTVERVQGGALVRATSLADSVGAFQVTLEPLNRGEPVDGVLTYELRAFTAPAGQVPMPARARSHVAAAKILDADLAGVREIRVQAERNTAVTRR